VFGPECIETISSGYNVFIRVDPKISQDVDIVKLFCTTQRVDYGRMTQIDFRD